MYRRRTGCGVMVESEDWTEGDAGRGDGGEVVAADEGQCVEEKVEECVAVAQLLKKNA